MTPTLLQMDFYAPEVLGFPSFDGIITDPPYKGSTATNCPTRLQETAFDPHRFLHRTNEVTQDDAFLILFCNLPNLIDIGAASRETPWKVLTHQIWDKRPTRSWISWARPLRVSEFILYLTKGKPQIDFRNGEIHPPSNRKSWGGSMKAQGGRNTAKNRQGMYEEILAVTNIKKKDRVHPTQKPEEFGRIFKKVVGEKRVLDPYCGSGALLTSFPDGVGLDVECWW